MRFLLIAALSSCASCACTDADCFDELSVYVSAADGGLLDPGDYLIRVVADGVERECAFAVGETEITSDCALVANLGLIEWRVPGDPDRVTVTVDRAGARLVETAVEPDYERIAPNGEICGPVCHRAALDIEL